MKSRLERLTDFIKEYAEDYLGDGTKNRIIKALEDGDNNLAVEILKSMNREWIKRAKELKKFYIFSEWKKVHNGNNEPIKKTFYQANYIDSAKEHLNKIPTLRRICPREIGVYDILSNWDFDR